METSFRFKQFSVRHRDSALKVGTDAVVLGAAVTIYESAKSALDIGTGTGVIALMLAQRTEKLWVTGIDIDSPSALEAKFNFENSPWPERLEAICADLKLYDPKEKFDLIVSNPPYFIDSLRNPDSRLCAARHNSSLNLRDIFSFAQHNLKSDGQISLILPYETEIELLKIASQFGFYPFRILRIKTSERKAFRRIIAEFSHITSNTLEEEIILNTPEGHRSKAYSELTKDFYL